MSGSLFRRNWFRLGVLLALCLVGCFVYYHISLEASRNNFVMQEKCAKAAKEFFREEGFGNKSLANYRSHYNKKLNRGFVVISSMDHLGDGIFNVSEDLYDVFERKLYAEYAWQSQKDKKFWEVKPYLCRMLDESGETKEDFDNFVKQYMED